MNLGETAVHCGSEGPFSAGASTCRLLGPGFLGVRAALGMDASRLFAQSVLSAASLARGGDGVS